MKKNILILALICALLGLVSCKKTTPKDTFDTTKVVTRYSRDSESGTRDGFFTAIGYAEAKEDDSKIPGYVKATDNANMISLVKNDEYGIGYISLASLAESGLKALNYEGVAPSEAAVIDGSYKLSRNFNYITTAKDNCTETEWLLIQAFVLFTTSKEGQGIIKAKDGITTKSIASALSFQELLDKEENKEIKALCEKPCAASDQIEIKFGGSTSVEKIAKALSEAFAKNCPTFKAVHNHTGSGAAYKGTQGSEKTSVNKLHVGFLSRELNASETPAENTSGMLCKDGIVVVVNVLNDTVTNITKEQLKKIYATENIKWSEIN